MSLFTMKNGCMDGWMDGWMDAFDLTQKNDELKHHV